MLSRDDFKIKRSPARICWHIIFRGQCIDTADTKEEAEEQIVELLKAV